jgi:DNA replication protein DnaC
MTACDQCDGNGFVTTRTERGMVTAVCECRRVLKLEKMLERAGLPARYHDASFTSFEWRERSMTIQRAYLHSKTYAENFLSERTQGLLLHGSVGTGKTHLAIAITRYVTLELSVPSLFVDFRQLLKRIQATFSTSTQTTEDVMRPILHAELLVLDEIGAARQTDWTFEIMEEVLNQRYNDARATVMTTNLPNLPCAAEQTAEPSRGYGRAPNVLQMESLGDRIGTRMFSRVQQMCTPMEMQGTDYRRQK